jgi:hypothetical protein
MAKQLAILIDASGSMFQPSGNGSSKDKIVEASESVQYIIDEIQNKATVSDPWAVSFWFFASQTQGLIGQGIFPLGGSTVLYKTVVADTLENQSTTQGAVGNLTDIFLAVRTVADSMVANPPAGFPAVYKKKILLFTDGNQTVLHGGLLTRAGYESAEGISLAALLAGNGIALNAQGIGSDLLNTTLTDLVGQAEPFGSSSKVISTTPGFAADTSAALMTNSMKIVNNNGILPLRPVNRAPGKLLWEQFSLPTVGMPTTVLPALRRVNHDDFEVDVDEISHELLLGLTWHHAGQPSIEAQSPSGTVFRNGLNGAFEIGVGWMTALHVPSPESGTWRVRVTGDPQFRPLRMNLMARSVCPEFDLRLDVDPFLLEPGGASRVTATPLLDGKTAAGRFEAVLSDFAGRSWQMAPQQDGSLVADPDFPLPGLAPLRVELQGRLEDKRTVQRMEFTTVQVGRPRDPRLTVVPDRFQAGHRYKVDVAVSDAAFTGATQIRFGAGIEVKAFTVLSALAAVAEITVEADAAPGSREVLTYQPDAETMTGVEIVCAPGRPAPTTLNGFVRALRFDAAGRLLAVVLDEGCEVRVAHRGKRLRRLLEDARDKDRAVKLLIDEHSLLRSVEIGA